jgi:hypothetical protein
VRQTVCQNVDSKVVVFAGSNDSNMLQIVNYLAPIENL